jgi:hypothetical protein
MTDVDKLMEVESDNCSVSKVDTKESGNSDLGKSSCLPGVILVSCSAFLLTVTGKAKDEEADLTLDP